MIKFEPTFEENLRDLKFSCSFNLYDNPLHEIIVTQKWKTPRCPDERHDYKIIEEQFGEAMMIHRICKTCYYGESEVIPPRIKKVVLTQ